MIKKLWVVTASNIMLSITFVLVSWALIDAYRTDQWGWFTFFAFLLPVYIFRLALISAFYDKVHRSGDI